MKNTVRILLTGILVVSIPLAIHCHYIPVQFYYPKMLSAEPRLQKDWLSSLDAFFSHGTTTHAINNTGSRVPLFDIYGIPNLTSLVLNICNTTPQIQNCLNMVPPIPSNSLSINGRFRYSQILLSATQNITNGFFASLFVPIRELTINSLNFSFIPTTNGPVSSLSLLDSIMSCVGLYRHSMRHFGLGDITVGIGGTHSFLDHQYLDFIDTTLQIGLVIPTGKQRNQNELFSLPFGFDGHWACMIIGDASFGALEWFTAGLHLDMLAFVPKTKNIRIKTDESQSGVVMLAMAPTTLHKHPQFSCEAFLKADHAIRGLSGILSYSFTYQGGTHLTSKNSACNNTTVLNSDNRFKRWFSHVLHGAIEYDFTTYADNVGPRVSIFYERPVSGRNIFLTSVWTGHVGVDINWDF